MIFFLGGGGEGATFGGKLGLKLDFLPFSQVWFISFPLNYSGHCFFRASQNVFLEI